jgi:hypothetical protein
VVGASPHLRQAANYGVGGNVKSLQQLSIFGKSAQDRRDKAQKGDKAAAESSNQGKSGSQESKTGQKK